MSKEKLCLLCKTKNVKYDAEFLDKRTYFSAPKLRELRIKWNEAITKIHPLLKTYVDNMNTYQICDLHFRESDIKKNLEKNGNFFRLPISKWGLKIEALPLSTEELESEKNQKNNANLSVGEVYIKTETLKKVMSQNENEEQKSKGKQTEKSVVKLQEDSRVYTVMDQRREDNNNGSGQIIEEIEKYTKTQKGQETQKGKENVTILALEKSLPSKEIPPENDKVLEKEITIPVKSVIRQIRTDYSKKVEVKLAPYPVLKSFHQKANFKGPQIVQIKSGKNQVFVVPPGAQVIPFSPTSSMVNTSSPAIRVPVMTQVTSLQGGSPVTKLIPITTIGSKSNIPQPINNVVPGTKVSSGSQVPLVRAIPLISRVNPGNSIAKVTPVSGVTKVNSISAAEKVPPISKDTNIFSVENVKSPFSSSVTKVTEEYEREKLLRDLQRYPLPTGWAYSLTTTKKIMFTQYYIHCRFPIFLRLDDNKTAMISVGHLATNFIPYELELECYANLVNCLRKLENLSWCKGIGFNNNNHSDLCSVLVRRANSRCKECARIRKNEQRIESDEILRRQRQKRGKNLKVMRNLKRINQRLEAKVSKMKLMVAHLKSKQCVDCLHEKFMKKALVQTESASKSE